MSLTARPKRHMTDTDWNFADIFDKETMRGTGDLKVQSIYDREEERHDGIVIECEIMNPPSSKGKTIYVFFNAEDVTKALLEFRSSARLARSQPEKTS